MASRRSVVPILIAPALCCGALALQGCGKASVAKATEGRLATILSRVTCERGDAAEPTARARRIADARSALGAARGLPAVARLESDLRAYNRVTGELDAIDRHRFGNVVSLLDQAYTLRLRSYEDEKALGIRCLVAPRRPIEG